MKWTSDMNFTGKNYAAWKARVKMMLQAKRLWSIVTLEEMPPPRGAGLVEEEYFWTREHEAAAFLMTTLSDEMVVSVSNKRYAYEIFQHLEKTYEPRNWGNLCALRDQFVRLKYKDGTDMLTHINELKMLAGQLANQGKAVDDAEKVCQLLSSLPSSWDSFKSIYYIQETPIAWPAMEANVMAEAARRNAVSSTPLTGTLREESNTEANAVTQQRGNRSVGRRRSGNRNGDGRQRDQQDGDAARGKRGRGAGDECHYCHQQGHYKADCPMRKRHRSEMNGGSANVAVADETKEQFDEQHASSATLADVWGLSVFYESDSEAPVSASESSASSSSSDSWETSASSDASTESLSGSDGADLEGFGGLNSPSLGSPTLADAYWTRPLCPFIIEEAAQAMTVADRQVVGPAMGDQQNTPVIAAATASSTIDEGTWIIDSGCSQHISFVQEVFEDLQPCGGVVTIANNATAQVKGVGTVKLHIKDHGGKMQLLQLSDVLYLPELRKNLISVTQLAQKGVQFDFHSTPGKVKLTRGPLSLVSESLNGVCVLKVINKSELALYVFPELTYDLAHRRFGHASQSIMDAMLRHKLVTGLRVNPTAKAHQGLCDACQLGTKHRSSFPPAPRQDTLECNSGVHSDICGPVEIPSLSGKRYVLLFVDAFSRYCHVYLLARRSEFFKCVLEHKAAVENKHSRPLRKFTSDNAGEYLSDEFRDFCTTHGIERGTTVPHTPEQNGLAEVRFRILFNKVRTILIDSNSPKQLWAEALQVVVYLQNRTMNTTTRRTPFEAWHGFAPDVSHLRVFGSLAYVYLPRKALSAGGAPGGAATRTAKRQKLDYRAVRGIFVGYASHQKAWKILDCASGSVVASCHVSFDESFSPAAEELRRQEFRLLSRHLALDFNYYARSATSEIDLLFYSQLEHAEKPTADDVALLEDFVSSFDLSEVNFAHILPLLHEYDPVACAVIDGIAPQVSTKRPSARNPVLNAVRKQQEAAALVALENVQAKTDACLLAAFGIAADPRTYDEAVTGPDARLWGGAINQEAASLRTNGTWTLVRLPAGKRALSCRWLFKKKYKSDGSIDRYKARLVVIGCQQVKYRDFDEIFAPVVRLESLRVLLAIACIEDLEVHQMDIETAFLNGTLSEEVYMKQPEGMVTAGKEDWVCKLHKSLYGLKQAPRAWHQALTSFLTREGFEKLSCESCIYTRTSRGELEIVAIYVDDLLLLSKTVGVMSELKQAIGSAFKAKDLGEVNFILGLKITRDRSARKLWINQQSNAEAILKKFNMEHGAGVATPTAAGKKLTKQQAPATEEATAQMLKKPFRQAVGSLMYQMIGSRPDMAFAIQDASRFLSNYGEAHWQAVKRCIRYLKATQNYGLEFGGDAVVLRAFTDSDYAGCEDDRRSVSGYVTMIGNCTVTWSSRKQRIVAQSTAEAEYVALAHCTREVLFLRQLLKELGYEQGATVIHEDNQACIAIAENPAQHSRVKHIDVRYHFIREHVQLKDVELEYVVSKDNLADAMTKGLPRDQHEYLRGAMNVKSMG